MLSLMARLFRTSRAPTSSFAHFFLSCKDSKPLKSFQVADLILIFNPSIYDDQGEALFCVRTSDKEYEFLCDSIMEAKRWIECIRPAGLKHLEA
jgi:hypothetical protein